MHGKHFYISEAVAVPAKKKKTLKEKIAEKEDQRKKEIEQKMEKKQVGMLFY